jgi:hypothetical protein
LAVLHILSVGRPMFAAVANGEFNGVTFIPTRDIPGWNELGLAPFVRPAEFDGFAPLGDDIGLLQTPDSFSGQPEGGVSPTTVETTLEMPAGSIATLGNLPSFGAAIWQTFSADAGDTLSFQYNHVSFDDLFADYSFVYLSGPGGVGVTTLALLGNNLTLLSPPDNLGGIPGESGMETFTSGPLSGGLYTLGLGVFNGDNFNQGSSALMIDNVLLTPSAIPESQPWVILAVVAAALAAHWTMRRCQDFRASSES